MEKNKFQVFRDKLYNNVSKVIVGKEDKINNIIIAFICSGHVLLEDVPGLGKTKLSRALAKSLNCTYKRIQFTPDLLPSDLTGVYFYDQKSGEFEFRKGPLLSQFVLADEINRATPRTQSALLECMEERQITVEGNTIKLNKPFFVIGTQNPIEQFGTFPLPEAQLDRFFMRISLGYPKYEEEIGIMNRFIENEPLDTLESVITIEEIQYVQNNYVKVHVSDEIKRYILDIITETRNYKGIEAGCSPRGTLNLMKGSQACAAISGRDYVIPEDVKAMAIPILSHRISISNGLDSVDAIIENILNTVKTPMEQV
ncbi:AAA family ATPase [Clostridium oryzae]|uniref:ATPase family n=1 Tax=Clostridium oryzae TaxID=1450648 RepID=A0A1V4IH92_9CLOT|nr:MoxR family ATPase [Clostridium oryzae]OPJ59323.1 ATPase family [Clostridium oryzae]